MNKLQSYPEQGQVCMPIRQTIRERLQEQQRQVADQLANIESALKFMDDNPNFENFHNLISKIGF